MSAKEELIAAALTAADELDEIAMSFCSSIHPNSDNLREACARAMVQPDMEEAERLVQKLESCAGWAGETQGENRRIWREEQDISRTALLDYVRGVLAERDALKQGHIGDANKMMPGGWPCEIIEANFEHNTVTLKMNHYGYIVGSGQHYLVPADAAPQPVSAAEVPMPEPVGRLYFGGVTCGERDEWELDADQGVCDRINESATEESRQRVYLHRDVLSYGDAREAAGYAAGLAAGGKDAERYQHAKLHGWPEYRCEIHPNPNGVPQWGYCGYWFDSPDAAIDAALRGEVKS